MGSMLGKLQVVDVSGPGSGEGVKPNPDIHAYTDLHSAGSVGNGRSGPGSGEGVNHDPDIHVYIDLHTLFGESLQRRGVAPDL